MRQAEVQRKRRGPVPLLSGATRRGDKAARGQGGRKGKRALPDHQDFKEKLLQNMF